LSNTHPLIIKAFIERFGAGIYTEGQLNRKKVANIVFNDQDALHWINQLVHPIVQEDYNRWVEEQHARIIVKEAAILIESGAYKDCDKIVVVTAPIKVRIERVVKRDHLTEGEVLQRILHQMDDEERKGYANFVIVNDVYYNRTTGRIKFYINYKKHMKVGKWIAGGLGWLFLGPLGVF
jgi:dephospho-CoA kinase